MSNLSALVGAILFAWFPEEENPHRPGPKFRPVLVLDVDPDHQRLCVAYGTSQRVGQNRKGEITFGKNEISGLTHDTKFCLGKSRWIPLASEYLAESESSSKLAVLGLIPQRRRDDLIDRLEEVFSNA